MADITLLRPVSTLTFVSADARRHFLSSLWRLDSFA
jgi:hypothetical protein